MTPAERNKKYREDHKDELRIKRKIYVEKNNNVLNVDADYDVSYGR